MRIGIEAQRIFRKKKHGMDFVVLNEIKELQSIDHENEYFIYVKPGEDRCLESTSNFHVVELSCPSYPLWEQFALPRAAKRDKVDFLHCTSNTAPVWNRGIPLVLTLHDIIFLEPRDKRNTSLYQNLGRIYRRFVVPRILDKCRRIITVSNYELNNIIEKLKLPRNKMTMIYNACDASFYPMEDASPIYRKYIDEPGYILFFGNTDPKKNTETALRGYGTYVLVSHIKRKLLVADLDPKIIDSILKKYGLEAAREYIVPVGYIPHSDLPGVYNGAFALLYPSLRESFGLPVLEAMSCGTFILASDTTAIPEIAGDCWTLVHPDDYEDIAGMTEWLETDEGLRDRELLRGLERSLEFSWEKSANELLALYEEVYQELK